MSSEIPPQYQKLGHVRDCLDAVPGFEIAQDARRWALEQDALRRFLIDLIPTDERDAFAAALDMLAVRAVYQFDRAVMDEALDRAANP